MYVSVRIIKLAGLSLTMLKTSEKAIPGSACCVWICSKMQWVPPWVISLPFMEIGSVGFA